MSTTTPPNEQAQREAFRTLHQVRVVTPEEEGSGVDRLPSGVYGFTHSPASPAMPLFARKLFYSFEVHKAADGAVYLIGFLAPEIATRVETNRETLDLRLFPDPQDSAVVPVSLPAARLEKIREQSYRDANGLELKLHPASTSVN